MQEQLGLLTKNLHAVLVLGLSKFWNLAHRTLRVRQPKCTSQKRDSRRHPVDLELGTFEVRLVGISSPVRVYNRTRRCMSLQTKGQMACGASGDSAGGPLDQMK